MAESNSLFKSLAKEQDDEKFWKSFLYVFELAYPAAAEGSGGVGTSTALFPLLLAPQAYTIGDPFTVSATPVLGGGLYVEENGVIARPIRLRGTTGFEPRKIPDGGAQTDGTFLADKGGLSFDWRGDGLKAVNRYLSGQRRFHMLQDRVFRLYADLKRNPETSADTKLFWHNFKDDQHWRVIPQNFQLSRGVPRRTMYMYDIQMLAVEKATAITEPKQETLVPIFERKSIKEEAAVAVRGFLGWLANLAGKLRELTKKLRGFINSVQGFVDNVVRTVGKLVSAVHDFVNGISALINLPFQLVAGLMDAVSLIVDAIDSAVITPIFDLDDNVRAGLATVAESWRGIGRSCDRIAAHCGEEFRWTAAGGLAAMFSQGSTRRVEAAGKRTSPSIGDEGRRGTDPGPGDHDTDQSTRNETSRGSYGWWGGSRDITINQGEDIKLIAQRELGDESLWPAIAELNGLRAPYIHSAGLPGTLRPGDEILIPVKAKPSATKRLPAILGTVPSTPNVDRLFGVDWALVPDPGGSGQYDMQISPEGDTDAALIRGIDNLKQGVGTRLRTSQGDSGLFQTLGTQVILGTGVGGIDRQMAKLRLAQSVEADPRITGITGLTLNESVSADIVDVEFNATVYGLTEKITIATDLPR